MAPVVSAVNGICQGGGLLIAMLSDVAVVSERATFRAPELLRGIADAGYAAYLPPHIGVAHARDLLFTAARSTRREALAWVSSRASCRTRSCTDAAREVAEQHPAHRARGAHARQAHDPRALRRASTA